MAANDLVINVVADTSRAINEIARLQQQIRNLTAVSTGLQVLSTAFQLVRAAVGRLRGVVSDTTAAWDLQYGAMKRLAVAVANAGPAFGATRAELEAFASTLQAVTNYGDEAIIPVTAYFVRLGLGAEQVKRATKLTLDLAAATGRDLVDAAHTLGRALNSPESATRSLIAAGIMLTQQEREQLRVLREAGDAARTQAAIMDILQARVAGAAEAMASPAKQLANLWGDLKEQLGRIFGAVANALATLLMPALQWLVDYMQSVPTHANVVVQAVRLVLDVLDAVRHVVQGIITVASKATQLIVRLGSAIPGLGAVRNITPSLHSIVDMLDLVRGGIQMLTGEALKAVGTILRLLSYIPGLGALKQAAEDARALGRELLTTAWTTRTWGDQFVDTIATTGKQLEALESQARDVGEALAEGLTESHAEVERIIQRLREEFETLGMTEAEKTLWKLERAGATEEELDTARALLQQIEAQKEAQEELNRAHEDALRILAETRTEEEKMQEQILRAQELLARGFINVETYLRYLERLRATITPPEQLRISGPQYAAAVQRGPGAFSHIMAAVGAFREAGEKAADRTARNTDTMVRQLNDLINAVRNLDQGQEIDL